MSLPRPHWIGRFHGSPQPEHAFTPLPPPRPRTSGHSSVAPSAASPPAVFTSPVRERRGVSPIAARNLQPYLRNSASMMSSRAPPGVQQFEAAAGNAAEHHLE